MSTFSCCFWWFLAGLLIGWLLNWLFSKLMGKDDSGNSGSGLNTYNKPDISSYATTSSGSAIASSSDVTGTLAAGKIATSTTATGIASADFHMMSAAGANVDLARAAGFKIKGNHDLEIIEGIGPKIAALFTEHGVGTFDKVMHMSVPAMLAILEKGGPRFKLAKPGTWAEQAKLCYENRWTDLRDLQDKLSAGIDTSESHNA